MLGLIIILQYYIRYKSRTKLKTKKIYLLRHGQTDYNLKGIVQGSGVDTDLNETGQNQAKAFFNSYKYVPFDKIYISALKRTKQSVQPFINLGIPYETLKGLNEINWGNKDGQMISVDENTQYWQLVRGWNSGDFELKIEGGESPREVEKRLLDSWNHIISNDKEENILICMHGRAMRILLASILHNDLRKMETFEHHNLGLYILNYSQDTGLVIEKSNCKEHLKNLFC
jgi:broad specificity phosphatase PhoE